MPKKKHKILLVFLAIILLTILVIWGKTIRNTVVTVSKPLQRILWKTGSGFSDFLSTPFTFQTIKKDNRELTQKNLALLKENIELKNLKEENQVLKEALRIKTEMKFETDIVEVSQKEKDADVLIISKGKRDGISKGMVVITKDSALVGRVAESESNFSRVLLISSPNSTFNFEVKKAQGIISGVAKGGNNLKINFDYVPKESELSIGDVATTASLGDIFPKGFLIGEIDQIEKDDAEPYQQGKIKPYFQLQNVDYLLVIKNY